MAILAALNCLASFAPALDQALNEKLRPLIEGQGLKPVHAQPGTTFMKEVIDARTAWAERQFLGAFRRNHATAPKEELEVAVQFVRDALRFRFERDYRTGTQTARRLFDQAARLMGAGFEYSNDPLVVWLASTVAEAAVMKFPQPYPGALSRLDLPKERYTVALDFLILGDDAKATGRSVFAAINAADVILADPASYRPEEEEIFVHLCLGLIDADPVVSSEAMEKLVEHPRLSEWARCVLRGYFQIGQARRHAKPELDESETRARRALSRENVAKARDAALRAWEVDPKKP